MEVVGAVSSIAGIASLVGQSLSGLSSLYNFYKDLREASKTADQFLRAVTSLKKTIEEVEGLIACINGISDTSTEGVLASLAIHIEDCARDIARWEVEAKTCHPGGDGMKAGFKKFLVAVKKQGVKDVFQEMAAHKDSISLSLATTGRLLDIQQLNKADALHNRVDEIAEYGKVTVEALQRLESRYERPNTPNHESPHTPRSLSSIASQLSRIESLLSVGPAPASSPLAPWSFNPSRLVRTPSTSSLHSLNPAPAILAGSSRRNSISSPATRKVFLSDREKKEFFLFHGFLPDHETMSDTDVNEKPGDAPQDQFFSSFRKVEAAAPPRYTPGPPLSPAASWPESIFKPNEPPKLTDAATVSEFFNIFEALIVDAEVDSSTSQNLMQYIRYSQMTETIRVHVRMSTVFTSHFGMPGSSTGMKLKSQQYQEKIVEILKKAENDRSRYRQTCWNEGYDVEGIDRLLQMTEKQVLVSHESCDIHQDPTPTQHGSWWDVLHQVGPQNWLTREDRINSWLLQNLAAKPEEALYHRKQLQESGASDQLSEEEWARLVLKYWTLDGASRPSRDVDCSTNGAVNSDGACNSIRVRLFGNLPVREKVHAMDIDSEFETHAEDLCVPRKRKRDEGG